MALIETPICEIGAIYGRFPDTKFQNCRQDVGSTRRENRVDFWRGGC